MIEPDLTNRQLCCGAAGDHHWSDCPVGIQQEHLAAEERRRAEHGSLTAIHGGFCRCGFCEAMAAE